jgi:hypothetical protein
MSKAAVKLIDGEAEVMEDGVFVLLQRDEYGKAQSVSSPPTIFEGSGAGWKPRADDGCDRGRGGGVEACGCASALLKKA